MKKEIKKYDAFRYYDKASRLEYFLLEMSQTKKRAESKIEGQIIPLLMHLIIVDNLRDKDKDYRKHLKEIKIFKRNILSFNMRPEKNKTWFSKEFIYELCDDNIVYAKGEVERKYNIDIEKHYNSIIEIEWFSLFDVSDFDKMLKAEGLPLN